MSTHSIISKLTKGRDRLAHKLPRRRWVWRLIVGALIFLIVTIGTMFVVAKWYAYTVRDQPVIMGASFIPAYAEHLGLEPKATMDGLLDIGVKHFRLVSYWNRFETEPGKYNFDELDWQFRKAEERGAKITLSLGLRQPRWPECHPPNWIDTTKPREQWQPQLEQFITAVVNRYKDSPALASYQLENEYFLQGFGICYNYDRQRLVDEYNLVKKLDPVHPTIISRSNNALGIPVGDPKPDEYGVSIYKRVWDARITKRYMEYPLPAWFYGFLAGWQKINDGRDMIIHELQAEAWAPNGKELTQISLDEQNKSLNAERLDQRFDYGKATGMKEMYLWGAEYWYYRKEKLNDPSLWQVAQREFSQH